MRGRPVIGWLQQIAEILRPGGVLSLIVPDKRYCFDVRRATTTLAQLVDAELRGIEVPTSQQIFDHESLFVGSVETEQLWAGVDEKALVRTDVLDPLRFAWDRCREQLSSGAYYDVHASTFTPESFIDLIEGIGALELTDFRLAALHPTPTGSFEFYVTLEKMGSEDAVLRRQRQCLAVAAAREQLRLSDEKPPGEPMLVSDAERRLIERKRAVLGLVRGRVRMAMSACRHR